MAKAKKPADLETDTETPTLPEAEKGDELVRVTVTKFGAGQVSTGLHVAGEGDIYADRGDALMVSPQVAKSLEARGLAEAD